MSISKSTGFIIVVTILFVLMCSFIGCIKILKVSLTTDKTAASVGETIRFYNESEGEFTSWSWDFGDGATSDEKNPTHAYSEPGVFFVTLVLHTEEDMHFDTLDITVTGSGAGKKPPVTDSPNLTVNRLEMCSGPINRDECRPQPGAIYDTGEIVSIWLEITGFKIQGTGDMYEAWVRWRRYTLYAPDGGVIMEQSDPFEWHEFSAYSDDIQAFHGWWNIGQVESVDPLGEYRVEIEIIDVISGGKVVKTTTFVLK
jgi:hypothetical protein